MGLLKEKDHYYTPEEYFDISETAEHTYEYERGQIIAMGATSESHNDLVFNLTSLLKQATKTKGCKVHFETIRLEVEENGLYYLPDVMLTCDTRDHLDRNVKRYPALVVEVLSPTSETRDRGQKFHAYLRLPSLRYYVLVSQNQPQIEVFSKTDNGGWIYQRFDEPQDSVLLDQLDIQLHLSDVFEGVAL